MSSLNIHTQPNPVYGLPRALGSDSMGCLSCEAQAASVAALHSSSAEAEATRATAPNPQHSSARQQ